MTSDSNKRTTFPESEARGEDTAPVVLFDGVCNLCNGTVNFLIDRDTCGRLKFASLQSPFGQAWLTRSGKPLDHYDTFILVDGGKSYEKSTGALRTLGKLGFPWSIGLILLVIPRFLRDPIYGVIARRRYAWFGRSERCRMPTPELRARFISE